MQHPNFVRGEVTAVIDPEALSQLPMTREVMS
jgi:hypothetical protein